MSEDAAFAARLGLLRTRFVSRAREDGSRLRQALARLDDPATAPEAAREIGAIAHSLSGAGGTFGFPAVSAAAELVENAVPAGDLALLRERVGQLLAALAALDS